MNVIVYPHREKTAYGNIKFPQKWPMNYGVFPRGHPVGGGFCDSGDGQCGNGENIKSFRARGYWASCFPEGDGITWKPVADQSEARTPSILATINGQCAQPSKPPSAPDARMAG